MTKNIDNLIYLSRKRKPLEDHKYIDTDYGKIRLFDSHENKPVIINVPDAPNTIEHQTYFLEELSKNYRIICFEYPGTGFSYPNSKFDYSFEHGSNVIIQLMEILKIEKCSLIFSCSNGYYALNAAMKLGHRFEHIFISQTPSINSIVEWTKISVPKILRLPIVGQLTNKILVKKISDKWYDVALPRNSKYKNQFKRKSIDSLSRGGCFCLSSLAQGLSKDKKRKLNIENTKVTLVWGVKDFSHRHTSNESIYEHVKKCEIIEFSECGHFPELENTNRFVKLVNERLN